MAESIKGLKRTKRCAEFTEGDIGKEVVVMGWVERSRNKGALIFTDVRDRSGLIQVVFDEATTDKAVFEKAKELKFEYVVAVKGVVQKRSDINEKLKTGTIEVIPSELRILSTSDVLPFPIEDEIPTREELRLEYRYLDLRRRPLQENLMLRSKVTVLTRKFLSDEGFIEIETPTFCKSTPEGARDYLVPSRVNPGCFYALPQSPQLYKQLLMVSGMDRYFQLARCYRDEDLRADRQPEFTQIDMELSFVDIEDVIDVNSRFLKYLFKEVLNYDLQLPIQRMKWIDAMNDYGSDKPDTRFEMKLKDVTDVVKDCGFGVFANAVKDGGVVKGLCVKGQGAMPRKKIDALVEYAKDYGVKGLAYLSIEEDGSFKSSFSKFMTEDELNNLVAAMGGEKGDLLLFAADKKKVVWAVLGALRLKLGEELGLIDENKFNFLWVTEFPLFEFSEEENRLVAMHHPFTMVMDEDVDAFFKNPENCRAKAYDIVLNGNEIGGGSIRIHQPEIQERMFEVLGFTKEKAHEQFGFLLDAFKYGVPPHGGLAYGLDRVVMLMAHAKSIREVIAFPKTKDASCLMVKTPSPVDEKQLKELSIKVDID
ncbi:MAG: aspartate--tRNA ligase [Lachnospiraceae bacterium]|nr:aspartate--tRNA ligase [Lachnospiraceae bacterium]